ncbi:ABC transporter permease subunit [Ancylobacter dichloromethanicus]|uniref:Putrescine/spermidine ABC transporter permease n=1 Tax=Ancylobacter dichloromethanicus TaxID=518825 RepID=A0A9W6N096_9HYPH|nr:ABC transporter permease subunit [Ancylobacter dichloromethanicus]MBS7556716.1 ABC transporter permease subunit [Ancylobacter dichloromethanicus]GLK73569.1 putrescine/spermidine ABC transporter permease [Ancylobacter dichloromethanicus]
MATKANGRWLVLAIPYLWLLALFLVPFLIVFKISLSQDAIAQPPYVPTFDLAQGWALFRENLSELSFENYGYVLSWDNEFIEAYGSSLWIAGISTILLLLVGYPIAYAMARAPKSIRPTLLMLVILPFWTSFLIRVYAWIGILSPEGLLNQLLIALHIISPDAPLQILATDTAVYIGIVYSYLPFMILPLYAALEKMDETLLEAAADLGCPPFAAFWKITWPLSLPGVFAGCLLCFIPAVGEFVIPDLLGGSDTLMIGKVLWTEFSVNRSWTVSSAVAVLLLMVLVIPIVFYQNLQAREVEGR